MTRGSVALFGLGLSGGRGATRSCVTARVLLALDRLSRGFLPVSGSFWMNFFSTYFERIQDSLSPLWDTNDRRVFISIYSVKAGPLSLCFRLYLLSVWLHHIFLQLRVKNVRQISWRESLIQFKTCLFRPPCSVKMPCCKWQTPINVVRPDKRDSTLMLQEACSLTATFQFSHSVLHHVPVTLPVCCDTTQRREEEVRRHLNTVDIIMCAAQGNSHWTVNPLHTHTPRQTNVQTHPQTHSGLSVMPVM